MEDPPAFLFTSRTSGMALQFAMFHFEGEVFSRGVEILRRHYEKAKEYQRKCQKNRRDELQKIWEKGLETAPEDEEVYELGFKEATGEEGEKARKKSEELEKKLAATKSAYATEQALQGALFRKRQSTAVPVET